MVKNSRLRAAGALAVTVLSVGVFVCPAAGSATSARVVLADTRPAWATPGADQGPVADSAVVDARVYWSGRDPTGLAAYLDAVSQPTDPMYGHYLTPIQAHRRFGPHPAQVSAVTRWLRDAGFQVTRSTPWFLAVHGTVAALHSAFGVTLHHYRWHGGHTAPDTDVTVPAQVAGAVLTVTGLDSAPNPVTSARPRAITPCSTYYGQHIATDLPPVYRSHAPWQGCGYTPQQLRAAYGVTGSGLTGRGVTVGIVTDGVSPTVLADANRFGAHHAIPPLRPGQLTEINYGGGSAGPGSDLEEQLDLESVHTMAPDAHVVLVHNADDYPDGAVDTMINIVDGHLADLVSSSWGWADGEAWPAEAIAFHRVFQLGGIEGIGFYFASGDTGDRNPLFEGETAYGAPATDPVVTSVGATSLAIGQHDQYLWETGWGDSVSRLAADGSGWGPLPGSTGNGSGGGTSTIFTQPGYQRGVVPDTFSLTDRPRRMRVFPDIALDGADSTPGLVGITYPDASGNAAYHEDPVAGTSMSCPLFAGIQALAQQAAGRPLGFANPALYARYRTRAYHDVTDHPGGPATHLAVVTAQTWPSPTGPRVTYLAVTLGTDGDLHAGPGYDDVTGLGSPTRHYLDSFDRR